MEVKELSSDKRQILISGTDINLRDTFECGQCFRWNEDSTGYVGVAKGRVIRAIQADNGIILENTTIEDTENIWLDYFDLRTDYNSIIESLPDDDYLRRAADYGRGIRILKQAPLETLISFIISANNNIKRIKKIVEKFCSMYGRQVLFEGREYFTFPEVSELKNVTIDQLQTLNAGYRDTYLLDAVDKINNVLDFGELSQRDNAKLGKALLSVKGVGPKVCDCIMLFGFSRYNAFPKDVWIKRVISEVYGDDFDENIFGEYAGVAQQYLFHYARNAKTDESAAS